jgi:hypothetical protein
MSLRCGLHAVNAILRAVPGARLCDADELDHITVELHRRETTLCPEARDTVPDGEGNYPVEALFVALRRRRLHAAYTRHTQRVESHHTVGFLLGTGSHYVAVVRDGRGAWRLYDNGASGPSAAFHTELIGKVPGVCATIRVFLRHSKCTGGR